MPSSNDRPPGGRPYPADGDLPPELDPRRGRGRPAGRQGGQAGQPAAGRQGGQGSPQRPHAGTPLPPELDPRGRRAAARAAAADQPPAGRRAAGPPARPPRSDLAHGAALGLKIVATLCSLLVLVGSGWAWATYRNFNADITRVNAISPNGKAADGGIDGKDQNLLIVGNDDRDTASDAELAKLGTTRDGGSYNTDTMMVLHLPADGSKATAHLVPARLLRQHPRARQEQAQRGLPDGHHRRPRRQGRPARSCWCDTIENLTGLSIDHFVQIDLLGFYRISNAIGGVDVCLNTAHDEGDQLRHRPQGRPSDDQGHPGAGLRPAALRLPAGRPGPDQAPAVLPVGGVPQGVLGRHPAQPDQAAEPAQGGVVLAADGPPTWSR